MGRKTKKFEKPCSTRSKILHKNLTFIVVPMRTRITSAEPVRMEGDKTKPALLTQTCNLPNFSLMNLNMDKICSSSVTSQRYGNISPELFLLQTSARSFNCSSFRAQATTFIPCLVSFSATFLPIPTDAPVTSAILFIHLFMIQTEIYN